MRTVIELPNELLRRAKAAAALKGVELNDLLANLIEKGLRDQNETYGRSEPIPVAVPFSGRQMPAMTNAEIFECLDREADGPRS
ncbi:hypothetical protein OP10G_2132 [Fimbriimonas ginsengisoli Gsoil 348]|uniref:Uncharacterized protein n=1 Tax=Fimbriimonas ginsengisoli Gsoil 348 TaxID=661478 RepID=A0A068NRW0_FIMGI|nr:hypothetical protein OP10G_2132 [Fimbriimonas ginsengisoli Gsoil 348]